ncbi:MAG: flavodoxin-dependent (E)-4-hydroxy-3-methylbut-2-enyl-diphosphate synthase [Candidatus Omnitrophota bacterium]|nr:flavodoxin-dependent (E)-4-hydroxy-3-methylbut-2-enyl-diphosphate synthase [Candidatus Omnitrophota bacterium]
MEIKRRKTRQISVGNVKIGGNAPIVIQSMAKTNTKDVEATVKQIRILQKAGCEIVRVAVQDLASAKAIKQIKKEIELPLVADIHFHYKLALEAIENGADKIRLNPGNIFKTQEIKEIVACAKQQKIPIRVGLNSGSVKRQNNSLAESLVKGALDYIKILERMNFFDIVVSLKASNIQDTLEAYRKCQSLCDYPFHLGITAAGSPKQGLIKSSIGLGILLSEGIGDTIRVSLTSQPQEEVYAAKGILESLGLRKFGIEVISCPTCGRCEVNLIDKVKIIEEKLSRANINHKQPKKIAIMGCFVNGPGEAKEADIGIAFGRKYGLIFQNGKIIKKLPEEKTVDYILKELKR